MFGCGVGAAPPAGSGAAFWRVAPLFFVLAFAFLLSARPARGQVDRGWTAVAPSSSRGWHCAIWTGSRMIVWGGDDWSLIWWQVPIATGEIYDPATDRWTPVSTAGAPSPRSRHTAVWTGSRMIVWGAGDYSDGRIPTGGVYDPATDTWTPVSLTGSPADRSRHTAVWTGSTMIIWGGGRGSAGYFGTGGAYDPVTDTWVLTSMTGAPSPRCFHTAVWTGSRMIIWGGADGEGALATGGVYDPATDTWTATSTTGAPSPRSGHTAVWTGTRMIVWGGGTNTGGAYDPATDTWTPTSADGAPDSRAWHTAVAIGSRMVVWGGHGDLVALKTGGIYDSVGDTWAPTETSGAPSARVGHTAVAAGARMIVWGGGGLLVLQSSQATGGIYADPLLSGTPTGFYTVSPCRVFDSRSADLGGPTPLAAGSRRTVLVAGKCGIPQSADAVSLNLTVTQPSESGSVLLLPGGAERPLASTVNYGTFVTKANCATVRLSPAGELDVIVGQAKGSVHVIVDVSGYFQH